jgi:DNA-binding IclR family transcriptional regulator
MAEGKVQGAQSFARSIMVLEWISEADRPPGIGDLMELGGLTRPTLYRILASLESEGLTRQTPEKRYVLGSRLIGLAHRALAQNDIRDLTQEALEALRDETGETVHLAVRNLQEMVYIDKIESRQIVRMASDVGTRVPFHSSSVGRAYLAALPEIEAMEIMDELQRNPITRRTPTKRKRLETLIQASRKRGYSHDDEENETGIVCFGAAILDAKGRPAAAVSISVPRFRLNDDHKRYWQPLIERCAHASEICGYRP